MHVVELVVFPTFQSLCNIITFLYYCSYNSKNIFKGSNMGKIFTNSIFAALTAKWIHPANIRLNHIL